MASEFKVDGKHLQSKKWTQLSR